MIVNQLKIGNFAIEAFSGQIIEVIGLTKESITFSGEFKCEWRAEPILINEQWLLRFGFEKINATRYRTYYGKINNHRIGYVFNLEENPWEVGFRFKGEYFTSIKYVHELQNIYSALFGKELLIHF